MNTKLFLLIGTSLSFIPTITFAQCVATQDCATLGYTETSCSGGTGVKCPFGNKWACFKSDSECEQQFCDKYGFSYACTGTGYSGGVGTACGGKYAACTCASGYEWKDGSCQKQTQNGAVGELYYCNGKVTGVKASGMNFYVAMQDLGTCNWNTANSLCQSYIFCNSITGKLPTKDQLITLYNKKSQINTLLSTNNGSQLRDNWHWSSSYVDSHTYYMVNISSGSSTWGGINLYYYTRPILTSW